MSKSFIVPKIIRESSSGYSVFSIEDEMLTERQIGCFGEITREYADSLCRQVLYLHKTAPEQEVIMFINSPGGSVPGGLALYDIMSAAACPIRTVCLGAASGIASVLFAAGKNRDIMPHGKVKIYAPRSQRIGFAAHGEEASEDTPDREQLASIFARCANKPLEEVYEQAEKNAYLNADEAVAFGVATKKVAALDDIFKGGE